MRTFDRRLRAAAFLLLAGATCATLRAQEGIDALPGSIRGEAQRLSNQVESLEDLAAKPLPDRDDEAALKLKQIEGRAARLKATLADLRKKAERLKIAADHPAFASIERRIDAAAAKAPGQAGQLADRKGKAEAGAARATEAAAAIAAEGKAVEAFVDEQGGLRLPGVNGTSAENLQALDKRLAAIESRRAEAQKKIDAFVADFGGDPSKAARALDDAGAEGALSARSAIRRVYEDLPAEIADARREAAGLALGSLRMQVEQFERGRVHDFDFDRRLDALPREIEAAAKVAPDDVELPKLADRVKASAADWRAAQARRIDERTFAHDAAADTSPATLEGARLFARDEWSKVGPYEFKSLVVSGPWQVTKKNLVGQPTQYGLPVIVAVRSDKDGDKDVYRAFRLTFVTAEDANPKKQPPFVGAHVGDSGHLRPAAVDRTK